MRLVFALFAFAAGAGLVAAGVQGIVRHGRTIEVSRTINRIQAAQPIDLPAWEMTRLALRQSSIGRDATLAGIMAADEANRAGVSTPNGRVWLTRAVTDLRRGLASSPSDGLAWLRLASATYLIDGASPEAIRALRMSTYAVRGANEAKPLLVILSAAMWPSLEPDLKTAARSGVQKLWVSSDTRKSIRSLALMENGRSLVKQAVGPSAETDKWFDDVAAEELRRRQEPPKIGP